MKKKKAGRRAKQAAPRLTRRQILAWAEAEQRRTGKWPKKRSGPVLEASGETWLRVDIALRYGYRGLPGGSSLAQLLAEAHGLGNSARRPRLVRSQILGWIDDHCQRTGRFPSNLSGPVLAMPGETWQGVDKALRTGLRGLPKGSSLARLLAETGRKRNRRALSSLRVVELLPWAEAHFQRTHAWPTNDSGPIPEAPGETWLGIDNALRHGRRGLPGGCTLAQVIRLYRNVLLRAHWEGGLSDGHRRVDSPAHLVEILVLRQGLLPATQQIE